MAHKNVSESRRLRNKPVNGELKNDCNERMPEKCSPERDVSNGDNVTKSSTNLDNDAEITGRFIDVDETDHAVPNFTKIHVLKTRSSSEQNLMLKTSSLRKGKYLSSSLLYSGLQNDSDKLNNNFSKEEFTNRNSISELLGYTKADLEQNFDRNNVEKHCDNEESNNCDTKAEEETRLEITKGKSESECKELCDLIKAVSNGHSYKKNSNVYSVFQAKTVVSERRRSLPSLPKLIGQKINEHNQRVMSKSEGGADSSSFGNKDFKARTFRTLSKGIGRLLKRHSSVNISEPDPVFKVAYLGNVLTGWAKGEGCVDKPLATLWRNYNQSSKPDVVMKLSITNSGLKGVTKEHGLTEYWAHRITFCTSPPEFPKIFCWIYRHEGRKLKHELRCHAVLCTKELTSKKITTELQSKIQQALLEFKRDKISRQNARLSLANSVYENPSMPRRKILLSVGANNYKPPLERSKSAPKLMAIEEMCSEEDEEEMSTFGLNNGRTWTKENSPLKMCCKADDIFPSHTLGRRKCDRNRCPRKNILEESRTNSSEEPLQRHLSLEVDDFPSLNDDVLHEEEEENNERVVSADEPKSSDSFDSGYERISNHRSSGANNRVSFSFSNVSEASEPNSDHFTEAFIDCEDDNVFYCETDENHKIRDHQKADNDDKSINGLEQLCVQANFLVLDSDEGSISSGCETASTVTSSDIEMSSLPCNTTHDENENDNNQEKVSVLQRVQSFEQLFTIEKSSSVRSSRSSLKSNFSYNKSLRNFHLTSGSIDSEMTSSSPSDSACFSSSETGPASVSDEVSLVPLGEKHSNILAGVRRPYMRCSTFPPSDDELNETGYLDQSTENVDVCGTTELGFDSNFENQSEQVGGDSDSACSVESGYSELLDSNNQNEELIGNTVMV